MKDLDTTKSTQPTQYEVVGAFADWLAQWSWTHFATLTFSVQVSEITARRQFRRWIRRLEQRAQRAVGFFYAIEESPGGRRHLHALIVAPLASKALREAWPGGWADVRSYDNDRGARFYVAKSLATTEGEFDFNIPGARAA